MIKRFLLIVFLVLTAILIALFYQAQRYNIQDSALTETRFADTNMTEVRINSTLIKVTIAETDEELRIGLSGSISMPEDEGMLFVYKEKLIPSFWMYQMNFPLDIIWIADNKIVSFEVNVPNPLPDQANVTLPKYSPSVPVNYVLEVNAGFVEKNNIKAGDSVEFSKT